MSANERRLRNAAIATLDRNAVLCGIIETLVDVIQGKQQLSAGDDLDAIREAARHGRLEDIPAQRALVEKL